MHDTGASPEAPRGRRRCETERVRAAAARVALSWVPPPLGTGSDGTEWTDLSGTRRTGRDTREDVREWARAQGRFFADNMAWCSGRCCANPRRTGSAVTVQEARADASSASQMADLGLPGRRPRRCG